MEFEQTTIKTTVYFLATARYMALLNLVLLIASLIKEHCIVFNLLLAVALLYLHIRLDFDQRIFANSQNFNEFDLTLAILACSNRPRNVVSQNALKARFACGIELSLPPWLSWDCGLFRSNYAIFLTLIRTTN